MNITEQRRPKRVLAFSGKLAPSHFKLAVERAEVEICAIICERTALTQEFERAFPNIDVISVKDIKNESSDNFQIDSYIYEKSIREILSNPQTFYLAERSHRKFGLVSAFNIVVLIERMIYSSIRLISKYRPEGVSFQATPHNLTTWVFGRVAEITGVPVSFASLAVLRSRRFHVLRGIEEQRPLPVHVHGSDYHPSADLEAFLASQTKAYDEAAPDYERKRQREYRGKFWSTKAELRTILSGNLSAIPFLASESLRKAYCLRLYNRLARKPSRGERSIAFFLHRQPERTTIPEGGWYGQQWLAISTLSIAAAERGLEVMVKEHPSTFRWRWNSTYRSSELYKAIDALPNAYLCALQVDSFSLIDSAMAIATVKGSVMLEAILRGKPAISFGPRSFAATNGVFHVSGIQELRDALAIIDDSQFKIDQQAVRNYLIEQERSSYPVDEGLNTAIDAYALALRGEG